MDGRFVTVFTLLSLLALACIGALAGTAQVSDAKVLRYIKLQHTSVAEMKTMLVPTTLEDSPLHNVIPPEITDIVGVPDRHSLLVRATSETAIDQLEELVRMLDQPVKSVRLEVQLVKVPYEKLPQQSDAFISNPGEPMRALIAAGTATVLTEQNLMLRNGGAGNVSLWALTPDRVDVSVDIHPTIHPDNSITLAWTAQTTTSSSAEDAGAGTAAVGRGYGHMRSGTMAYLGTASSRETLDNGMVVNYETLILVTATVLE